jgi:serine/threonine protein kinase
MEWADGGNLEEFLINEFQRLTPQDKLKLSSGVANGIGHLHERNIIHRDLVSNNSHEPI